MDFIGDTQQEISPSQRLPICMSKSTCDCFEELWKFEFPDETSDCYVFQTINQIEYFIHLVIIHQNKERVIEIPISITTPALIVRRMVYFINLTRRKFAAKTFTDQICYIDFTTKCVPLPQYLRLILLQYVQTDATLEIMFYPDSELNIVCLKRILQAHLDLLFIFEQYLNLKRYGYTYSTKTIFGTVNHFQLFYAEE